MAYSVTVLRDSVSPLGDRLTTFEVCFPRMILAEFNSHRMLSSNAASSRAIPVEKQISRILEDPFVPIHWGVNQSGMQAQKQLTQKEKREAIALWIKQRDEAVLTAVDLMGGVDKIRDDVLKKMIKKLQQIIPHTSKPLANPVHKQVANRLLEPFMWQTKIVSATEWSNFFALRDNDLAQPEFRRIAHLMKLAYAASKPASLKYGQWHLPLVRDDEFDLPLERLIQVAVGRCARVSYLTHDGKRELEKDIALHDHLVQNGHMSPFEQIARPMTKEERDKHLFLGNLRGWVQYRKYIPNEQDFALVEGSSQKRNPTPAAAMSKAI